jgi:hypothetical protein
MTLSCPRMMKKNDLNTSRAFCDGVTTDVLARVDMTQLDAAAVFRNRARWRSQ